MNKKKIIAPKVVAGGAAVPLGDNFYYMTGKKHTEGGIDIGANPNTGLEVEDGEVMHLTGNEAKVFSSVPFLNGQSPAQKVINGEPASKVFNAQENYKDRKGINDDGTKKKNGGKVKLHTMKAKYGKRLKYDGGGSAIIGNKFNDLISNNKTLSDLSTGTFNPNVDLVDDPNTTNPNPPNWLQRTGKNIGSFLNKTGDSIGNYYSENPGTLSDTVGLAGNVVGSIISNNANNKMLNSLKYSDQPVARQAAKLKTTININPQLDKMRETAASYERDVNNNTASSRVALARKQQARVATMLNTNDLYGQKENLETDLINKDKLNQQSVADANLQDYNKWNAGRADFNNAVAEKKAENKVSLIENLNAGVQDVITRGEKRDATKNNMLTIAAAHPDVNPMILRQLGVTSITDKMISDWNTANLKKTKLPNN